jgi:pimeloyl-ACP methyl ester carboxylesterase
MWERSIRVGAQRLNLFSWDPSRPTAGGTPVLLVHGLGANGVSWWPVGAGLAERLGVTVSAVDLLGFGRTGSQSQPATIARNTELLRTVLAEWGPAVVIGNSMGAAIAIRLAARHPDLVRALVLVDPAVPTLEGRWQDWVLMARLAPLLAQPVGRAFVAQRTRSWGARRLVDSTIAVCLTDLDRLDPLVHEELVQRAAERYADRDAPGAYVQAARSLFLYMLSGMALDEQSVQCPTLVVHGDRDQLIPIRSARALALRQPAFELVELPGIGHAPQLEVPHVFLDTVVPWIGSRVPAPAPR